MNSIKRFFREKGLYLFCLAMVFAATVAGILALRSVMRNVADLTRARQEALQEENTWNAPDAIANNPVTDLPVETPQPTSSAQPSAPGSSSGASQGSGGGSTEPEGSGTPSTQSAPSSVSLPVETTGELVAAFSGDDLVYNGTLGDWRTHNGADYALAPSAGGSILAVHEGTVATIYEDALWGGIVEVTDTDGRTWKYCGLEEAQVKRGQAVAPGTVLGTAGQIASEAHLGQHLHLEVRKDGQWLDPEKER